jgi:AcrR family transcriptional regulator
MQRTRSSHRTNARTPLPAAHVASSPRRPRRTQESRSRAARERLLRAALEVLLERGYNGFTTKEVSVRAGFSNGALMHHYRTKADLAIAAGAHIYDQCIESGRRIAASPAARKNPLRAFITDCTNVYLGWPFIAALEILMTARTDPMINAQFDVVMKNYRKTMNEIWLSAFMRAGMSKEDASFLIMSTLNLIRGMGINSLWQKNIPYYTKMLREWERLARSGNFKGARADIR